MYLCVTEEQLGETLRTFVLLFEVVQRDWDTWALIKIFNVILHEQVSVDEESLGEWLF